MSIRDIFTEAVCQSQALPQVVRDHVRDALAVEESQFDESYIEFLDTQIRLEARGPEWTARLRQRREGLRSFCGVTMIRGVIPAGERHFTVRVLLEQRSVVYWEEYDYPYPVAA
jgi:hypothetical protein